MLFLSLFFYSIFERQLHKAINVSGCVYSVLRCNLTIKAQRREEGIESYKQEFFFLIFIFSSKVFNIAGINFILVNQMILFQVNRLIVISRENSMKSTLKNIKKGVKMVTRKCLFNRKYKAVVEEQRDKKVTKHVENSEMAHVNLPLLVITLIVNGLNIPFKRQKLEEKNQKME